MDNEDLSVKCNSCEKEFCPSSDLQKRMRKFINQGRGLIMLECPACHADIAWKPESKRKDVPFRCPVSQCDGWVSYVDSFEEGNFWGCGECGSIWRKKESLMAEISSIQEKYGYRKSCYQKIGDDWVPENQNNEVDRYDDLVQSEEPDMSDNFERDS
ncbi:hypothetical protein [Burkholderia paludis]|uniref:hypothetical protein n=1 Tax=Burkholderia paludis TaxID=1506587 RepID=UPI001269AD00|nr:hypothetical protein [Burkholderia paludis]